MPRPTVHRGEGRRECCGREVHPPSTELPRATHTHLVCTAENKCWGEPSASLATAGNATPFGAAIGVGLEANGRRRRDLSSARGARDTHAHSQQRGPPPNPNTHTMT
eukprot:3938414-Prymnesium_polylepis.1